MDDALQRLLARVGPVPRSMAGETLLADKYVVRLRPSKYILTYQWRDRPYLLSGPTEGRSFRAYRKESS